ncbi:MAG: putative toxin-antitoxin system toxin component, PIN family [Nodosilinea sp.]
MPITQIVIDTNIVVAGLRSRNGIAFRLLGLVGSEQFKINLSVPLVLEYEEVLSRKLPNPAINALDVQDFLDFHCSVATHHQIFFGDLSCPIQRMTWC